MIRRLFLAFLFLFGAAVIAWGAYKTSVPVILAGFVPALASAWIANPPGTRAFVVFVVQTFGDLMPGGRRRDDPPLVPAPARFVDRGDGPFPHLDVDPPPPRSPRAQ